MRKDLNKMVRLAVLAALGVVLMLVIRFPFIPAAPWLEYEPADVPVLIGGFMYGPVAGLIVAFIVSFIQAITVSASSGWVGFLMHMLSTGTFVIVASLIYKMFRNYKGAIFALVTGSVCMTIVMIIANLIITPRFWGVPLDQVKAWIVPIFIPFNMIKALGNTVLVLLLYKPLSRFIKHHLLIKK